MNESNQNQWPNQFAWLAGLDINPFWQRTPPLSINHPCFLLPWSLVHFWIRPSAREPLSVNIYLVSFLFKRPTGNWLGGHPSSICHHQFKINAQDKNPEAGSIIVVRLREVSKYLIFHITILLNIILCQINSWIEEVRIRWSKYFYDWHCLKENIREKMWPAIGFIMGYISHTTRTQLKIIFSAPFGNVSKLWIKKTTSLSCIFCMTCKHTITWRDQRATPELAINIQMHRITWKDQRATPDDLWENWKLEYKKT